MTQVADRNDGFVVRLNTTKGPAFIESQEQWREFERVGKFIGLLNRAKTTETNRVPVSAIITRYQEYS
jgi:hypothetical protein